MTTIAFDGRVLAADKLAEQCGLSRTTTKIARVQTPHGELLAGGSGESGASRRVIAWLSKPETPYPDEKAECTVIAVSPRGDVALYAGSGTPVVIEDKKTAIGSGRDFAIAAMHLGCSAIEAVRVATLFDTGTGLGVDVLEHR